MIDAKEIAALFGSLSDWLNTREQIIVAKYYGLGNEVRHTLDQIGKILIPALSRERVRQIKVYALRKLNSKKKK